MIYIIKIFRLFGGRVCVLSTEIEQALRVLSVMLEFLLPVKGDVIVKTF